ncbi:MAG: tetratricopeptide repeat protein [Labilithrix sp.]|nr:tetratricopeptide repeat protein [Labilithrix sp.]MCW5816500.1 tetratricopeptide repeat protein [Labilithrix sp.]
MKRLSVALAALLWTSVAAAQEPPPAEPYIAKFNEGRALVKANNYAEAVDKFKESVALKPASGTYLNLGDCYEHLGRYASAMEAFEKALELAADNNQPDREKEASDRAGKLQPMVSSITVTSAVKDAKVTVDGAPATLGQAFSVDGGLHVVHVELSCKRPKDIPVTVAMKSDTQTVAIDPATLDPDPSCASQPPSREGMSRPRFFSYVMGGAAVLSLGIGVAMGIVASSRQDDLEGLCASYPTGCAPARKAQIDEKYDQASSAATASTVAFIAAVAFLGAGIGLYVFSPEWQSKKAGWAPGRFTF